MAEEKTLSATDRRLVIHRFIQVVKRIKQAEGSAAQIQARLPHLSQEEIIGLARQYTPNIEDADSAFAIDGPGAFDSLVALNERDVWGADELYTRGDWQHEVSDGSTNLGYWDWVEYRKEQAEHEEFDEEEDEGWVSQNTQ